MNKRIANLFAVAALVGAASAFAANPFVDVPQDSWAYKAVSQLAAEGVVIGYPNGTFQGEKDITRYEMAEIIARMMANEERMNAEQRAVLNQLAHEFAAELNNLGVRVSNLENKVGNVKLTGDARLEYMKGYVGADLFEYEDDYNKAYGELEKLGVQPDLVDYTSRIFPNETTEGWGYRMRLQANAQVGMHTKAQARFVMENSFGNEEDNVVTFDRLNVTHDFGGVQATAGRQNLFVGKGLVYDDTFDGVAATAQVGPAQLTVGHGHALQLGFNFFPGSAVKELVALDPKVNADDVLQQLDGQAFFTNLYHGLHQPTVTLVQLDGKVAGVDASAYYVRGNKNLPLDVIGFGAERQFGKVWVGGEYATTHLKGMLKELDFSRKMRSAWVAGIGYGMFDQAQGGTWDVKVQYFNEGMFAPVFRSTWDQGFGQDFKGYVATAQYALANNVGLKAYYGFSNKTQHGDKIANTYAVQLNYMF